MDRFPRFVRLVLFLVIFGVASVPQQPAAQNGGPCAMPVFSSVVNEPNNLTEQQEEWLGEILAPQIQRAFNVIPDPENDYLDKLGQRLLAQLPPSKIHYRFTIIDLPANDSFGIPGGRIYISRKIIALAQNEDELAGLLAHEIGHIVTRQAGIDISRTFQTVLGINQFGDQKDVIEKWNRLLDMYGTKPEKYSSKREDAEQLIADRVALYAMARAGYQPSRFVEFFDRLVQTKGNQGSFWTDMFGKTSRDSRRLRELLRASAPLAQNCVAPPPAADATAHYLKWQAAVIGSKFAVMKEAIPGLISKTALNPPLRSDLHSLQYSPDGKYLVAQDDYSIFVLSGNPVTNLFTIDAPDSYPAQFTPDSRQIVFYDKELRVEKWDLEKHGRVSVHQLALPYECMDTAISHSGDILACVNQQSDPELVQVNTSTVIVKGKRPKDAKPGTTGSMVMTSSGGIVMTMASRASRVKFSPDDRYVLAASGGSSWAYDLKERNEVDLPQKLKEILAYPFTFLSANEVAGYRFNASHRPYSIELVRARFPSGEVLDNLGPIVPGELSCPAKGNYLLVRIPGSVPVMVVDLQTKKAAMMLKKPAFDIYDTVFADESASGEVGIFNLSDKKYVGGVDLPSGQLHVAMASAFSADGKWLAVSSRTRGAFWKVETGERTAVTRGFQGAWFDQDRLIAKYPRVFPGKGNDAAGVFKVNPSDGSMETLYAIETPDPKIISGLSWLFAKHDVWQEGDLLVRVNQEESKKPVAQFLVEVDDVRTNKKLWERTMEREGPHVTYSEAGKTMTLVVGDYDSMKQEARGDVRLTAGLAALADENRRKASYVVRVLDSATGHNTGAVLVDTGNLSFKVRRAVTAGDAVMVTDTDDRTLVYSLKTGLQRGRVFGNIQALSADGSKMLLEYGRGEVDLYDTASLQSLVHYTFPSSMVHAEFSADGKAMRILTADQAIYTVKATPTEAAANVH